MPFPNDFSWQDLAPIVAPLAPGLGSILGGLIPVPGGSYMGQKVGEMIAAKFGVPATPAAVAGAIQNNPNEVVLAHLRATTEEAKAMWPALAQMEEAWAKAAAANAAETAATMRVEILPENRHPYYTGWRPFAGWLFNFFAGLYGVLLAVAVVLAARSNTLMLDAIKEVQIIAGSLLAALAAVVGVYIIGRSQEKLAGRVVQPPAPAAPPTTAKKTGK